MAEEFDNEQMEQEEEQGKSLWEILNQENQEEEEEDQYDEEQEEQDAQIAKEDKLEKKLSAKMDNLTKKFETTMLRERISKFEGEADELEVEMFKTVASDVKSLEDFDKALGIVRKQAAQIRKTAEDYKTKLEEQAAEQVGRAWGTGPIGTPQKRDTSQEDIDKAIEKGDSHAALSALLQGDNLVDGIL